MFKTGRGKCTYPISHAWQKTMYLPYAQLWLTDAALQATEAQIGYKLPAAWIALLRIQNGSYIR